MKEFTIEDFNIIEDLLIQQGWTKSNETFRWYLKLYGWRETFEAYLLALWDYKRFNKKTDNKTLKYKDVEGTIQYDNESSMFYGKLLNISDVVIYDGKSIKDLETNFKLMVDYFLNEYKTEE